MTDPNDRSEIGDLADEACHKPHKRLVRLVMNENGEWTNGDQLVRPAQGRSFLDLLVGSFQKRHCEKYVDGDSGMSLRGAIRKGLIRPGGCEARSEPPDRTREDGVRYLEDIGTVWGIYYADGRAACREH